MIVVNDPVPYVLIEDVFSPSGYASIMKEIKMLDEGFSQNKVPESDLHHRQFLESNMTIHYINDISPNGPIIGLVERFIVEGEFLTKESDLKQLFRYIPQCKMNPMVHSYGKGAAYPSHKDDAFLTFLFSFWEEPKKFNGGEFIFTANDHKPPIKNNSCLIFTGLDAHKVTPVEQEDNRFHRSVINVRLLLTEPE